MGILDAVNELERKRKEGEAEETKEKAGIAAAEKRLGEIRDNMGVNVTPQAPGSRDVNSNATIKEEGCVSSKKPKHDPSTTTP